MEIQNLKNWKGVENWIVVADAVPCLTLFKNKGVTISNHT